MLLLDQTLNECLCLKFTLPILWVVAKVARIVVVGVYRSPITFYELSQEQTLCSDFHLFTVESSYSELTGFAPVFQ